VNRSLQSSPAHAAGDVSQVTQCQQIPLLRQQLAGLCGVMIANRSSVRAWNPFTELLNFHNVYQLTALGNAALAPRPEQTMDKPDSC
jgi:hypothetical protein